MKTKVIFRKWPIRQGGDVIALFPQEAGTLDPFTCSSYQTVGQHGSASVFLTRDTKPATPKEYAPLAAELRRIGYDLLIQKRFTAVDLAIRRKQVTFIEGTP